jgi:hypothetical protein
LGEALKFADDANVNIATLSVCGRLEELGFLQ